jgi:hypothetical protein
LREFFRSLPGRMGHGAHISIFPSISLPAILVRAHPVRQSQPQ